MISMEGAIHDLERLRDRAGVFESRAEAGGVLAEMLAEHRDSPAVILAIPAGGVPVAAAVAEELHLPLDLAVVSKITLPWNPEVGYGAVAFDGSVLLNDDLVPYVGLTREEIDEGIQRTTERVHRRGLLLRGERPLPDLRGRTGILVDDGLASGFTMRLAVRAVQRLTPARTLVAVPTAHARVAALLAEDADELHVANLRHGSSFAVADAYRHWRDVPEEEVAQILRSVRWA